MRMKLIKRPSLVNSMTGWDRSLYYLSSSFIEKSCTAMGVV